MNDTDWLSVRRGSAPLVLTFPHGGTDIPPAIERRMASAWLSRKDTDWHIAQLYAFADRLDATLVATRISRSVIDVNRDPSGVSLYPGQATTELCPTTTFDGEPLYRAGEAPDADEIGDRRARWFDGYHAAIAEQLGRLRDGHPHVLLYDCHSIRSHVPRLFDGELPVFNVGTDGGATCAPAIQAAAETACRESQRSWVANGRFRGGYTVRHHGAPARDVHALQMELACRAYLTEPDRIAADNWPAPLDETRAAPTRATLHRLLTDCLQTLNRLDRA